MDRKPTSYQDEVDILVDKFKDAGPLLGRLALTKMLETGVIDFTKLVESYVAVLEEKNRKKITDISTLGLMLASYCMNDASEGGKNARKHLYNSMAFEGSVFGDNLEKEFNS